VTLPNSPYQLAKRPPLRPPVGIPSRGESRRTGTIASILLHALIFFLVVAPPVFIAATLDYDPKQGAGGPGPAGGGGGGSQGTGGVQSLRERLQYMVLPKATVPTPPVPVTPPPKPVVEKKPEPPKPPPPEPTPPAPPAPPTPPTPVTTDASVVAGTGGGSGKDGTAGSGSGSGGGVGSGVGTGKGSGVGPGTGGGSDAIYPPAVVSLPILPLPVPGKVRPYKMVAYFEVDTLGNAKLLAFNPSNDGGYNKRIKEMLGEIRFRPATRVNGRPVVDTAVVTAEAPRS
jgi:periplasmic protein TonB